MTPTGIATKNITTNIFMIADTNKKVIAHFAYFLVLFENISDLLRAFSRVPRMAMSRNVHGTELKKKNNQRFQYQENVKMSMTARTNIKRFINIFFCFWNFLSNAPL